MTDPITTAQIRAIKAVQARLGLDDDTYRDLLARETGKRSSKALTMGEAVRFIDHLKGRLSASQSGHDTHSKGGSGAMRLSGAYAGVCRALWISAWNLGLIRERTDRALVAFVTRQTGIDHLNWVQDPRDGARVIEAIKAWIAREANVLWPTEADARKARVPLSRLRKIAVIEAQGRRLTELGAPAALPAGLAARPDRQLDDLAMALGAKIRTALARQAA